MLLYWFLFVIGGPFGAAGSEIGFNYERSATPSFRILGKELGIEQFLYAFPYFTFMIHCSLLFNTCLYVKPHTALWCPP